MSADVMIVAPAGVIRKPCLCRYNFALGEHVKCGFLQVGSQFIVTVNIPAECIRSYVKLIQQCYTIFETPP